MRSLPDATLIEERSQSKPPGGAEKCRGEACLAPTKSWYKQGIVPRMSKATKRKIANKFANKTARKSVKSPPTAEAPRGNAANRRSAESMLSELRRRLLEIGDLRAAGSLLGWDQATYMPRGGAAAR